MFTDIKNLVYSDTGKDTSVVFAATLINALFGGLFFIIVARILGPGSYGLFSTVAATAVLISNIAHFGIDTGILKFVNNHDKKKSAKILKLAFETYLLVGITIFLLGFILSPQIAAMLGNGELTLLFKVAFSGIILVLFSDYFIVYLQAKREFVKASVVSVSANIARLILLGMSAYFYTANLYSVTLIFFFVPVISVIVGRLFVPTEFLLIKDEKTEFKNFFSFNFWIFASLVISSIPFDNYFLIKFIGPAATGIYAAPFKLLSLSDQLAGNFSRVLASRFSSFNNTQQAAGYARKTFPILLCCFCTIVLGALVASPLVRILLGQEYIGSVMIFRLLAIGFAFYFANVTATSAIVYFFGESKNTFLITIIVKSVWVVLNLVLISAYQERGAATAFLFSGMLSFVIFNSYAFLKLKQRK